jgi:hypothetical protein
MRPANPSVANRWRDHLTMNYFGSIENVKSIEIRLMIRITSLEIR